MSQTELMRIENLSVRFGGVQALSGIDLTIPAGITFGIIGPNGAGKTTLFNCITGLIRPQPGSRIIYADQNLVGRRVDQIARSGIARTFQNLLLIRKLTVRENILTGLHGSLSYSPLQALFPLRSVRAQEAQGQRMVDEMADLFGFSRGVLDSPIANLSLGMQKKVEVARAVARKPRVLMVDEPAGGLNDAETRDLMESLRRVKQAAGLSMLLIDHDMDLVMTICDRLCVLNFGQQVAEGTPPEIAATEAVIDCYLGARDDA